MDIEGLKVIHALPGRVRLKVAKVKGNPALAHQAQKRLAQVPGIHRVEAKPGTGSLLIHYDAEHLFSMASMEILLEALGELFPEIEAVVLAAWLTSLTAGPGAGTGSGLAASITDTCAAINTRLREISGGLDLKLLAPLALVLLGLRGMWTSEKVSPPSWSNLLWFGFASFVMLNRGLVEGDGGIPADRKV